MTVVRCQGGQPQAAPNSFTTGRPRLLRHRILRISSRPTSRQPTRSFSWFIILFWHGKYCHGILIATMAGLQARSSMSLPSSLSAAFRNISLNTSKRSFSSTPVTQKTRKLPEYIPPYPHGPNYVYKQADSGLYGGVQISFGNKISQGRNEGKTRRSWKPNVRRKKIHSEALGEDLFIKVTRKALRTIRKAGGLDQYLLDDRPGRIRELGMFGWELRWRVMQTPKIQEQFKQERKRLGLPEPPTFEEWVKQKEAESKAQAEDQTNIKEATKPFYNKQLY